MADEMVSPATLAIAQEARSGRWGRELVDLPLTLDGREDLRDASQEMLYSHGVMLVARQAPLRIGPTQLVVGAATLEKATHHMLPVYRGDKLAFPSTSHTTLGFDRLLKIGYSGLRRQIHDRIARGDLDARGRDLMDAMLLCLDAAAVWHRRHMDLLAERIEQSQGAQREHYEMVAANLADVPENPPRNFRQAVQALWMAFSFQRLVGNWPGIGRIDKMLGGFLRRDLADGTITLEQAREWLAHFWINGCDWVGAGRSIVPGSGDAQWYQNIVLGGVDEDGRDVTNEVTYLVLDVVEQLRINEFPIAVRIAEDSPPRLLRRVAQVQRLGGGMIAVYNDRQIVQSLVDFGYPLTEARDFANDGCWEILIPGKTNFGYWPFDTLALLQQSLGVTVPGAEPAAFATFEELYADFRTRLASQVGQMQRDLDGTIHDAPCTTVSMLIEDCIERGRGYYDGGARYTVRSPHAGGLADTGNSLLAIDKLVYRDKRFPLPQLVGILRDNWQGHEPLRQELFNGLEFYGNGGGEGDAMVRRVFDDFLAEVDKVRSRAGVLRPPGVSTFGREIEWRPQRKAVAMGKREGDILALNFSPTPGTDRKGPTAVIASHCSMGLSRLTNGTALEIKMHPSNVEGEAGLDALQSLLETFVRLGGIFMHVDVVDNAMLRDAQANPEKHQTLAVRVSGWSARFVTLDRNWQEMVINRTTQGQ